MYRKPKFLELLHEIREEMSREADYDVDLFAEMLRSDKRVATESERKLIAEDASALSSDKNSSVISKRKRKRTAGRLK